MMNITKTIRFFLPKPLEDFLDKSVLNHAYMNTRALSWKIKDCLYCNIFRRDLLNLQKKVRWQLFLKKKKNGPTIPTQVVIFIKDSKQWV